MSRSHPQLVFDLQLERTYLRTVLAVERRTRAEDDPVLGRIRRDLTDTEVGLDRLRLREGADLPDDRLRRRLGLDDVELDLLWTATSVACDPRIHPHAQLLSGGAPDLGATMALHAAVHGFDLVRSRTLVMSLAGSSALLRHRLLVPATTGRVLAATPLAVPSRVIRFLAGDDTIDPSVLALGGPLVVPAGLVHDPVQRQAIAQLAGAMTQESDAVAILCGPAGSGRRSAIAAAAALAGRRVIALDLGRVRGEPEVFAALQRECLLGDAIPVLLDADDLPGEPALPQVLASFPGLVVLTTSTPVEVHASRRALRVAWSVPEVEVREQMWRAALGAQAVALGSELPGIARRFHLGGGGIGRAVETARMIARSRGDAHLAAEDIVAAVRSNVAERLGELADRIEIRQGWDDLVLPRDTLDQVQGLVARVRHAHVVFDDWGMRRALPRGQGVAALFSGPPGTGKTMVAGLIARELGLDLYQVDLSKIMSKWIGETEKQLARLFEAAEAGHALLLFDEADSLFAKRTEVRSANDRHANLEVNYLLQRIESFGGVAILTTNLEDGIDPAVKRRLAAHVVFWPPEHEERVELWRRFLGGKAPIGRVDCDALAASFSALSGAHIRNAALGAAFLAAAEGVAIDHAHLVRAARVEYRGLGRVLQDESPDTQRRDWT